MVDKKNQNIPSEGVQWENRYEKVTSALYSMHLPVRLCSMQACRRAKTRAEKAGSDSTKPMGRAGYVQEKITIETCTS